MPRISNGANTRDAFALPVGLMAVTAPPFSRLSPNSYISPARRAIPLAERMRLRYTPLPEPLHPLTTEAQQEGRPSLATSLEGTSSNLAGTQPLSWLPSRYRYSRLARLPSSDRPVNWLSSSQLSQVGEVAQVAQFRRYRPAQLVAVEVQVFQVGEVAQVRRYRPAQLVVAERQHSQVGEVAQVRRYRPAQLVVVEVQVFQVGEVAQVRRYRPAQLVVVKSTPRLARLPSSDGIDPLNSLPSRYRYSRLARLPRSGGIDPLNWLS